MSTPPPPSPIGLGLLISVLTRTHQEGRGPPGILVGSQTPTDWGRLVSRTQLATLRATRNPLRNPLGLPGNTVLGRKEYRHKEGTYPLSGGGRSGFSRPLPVAAGFASRKRGVDFICDPGYYLHKEGIMGTRRPYSLETVKMWMERALSGDMQIYAVGAGVPPNTVGYAIVSQLCKMAVDLKARGKRIELRIVDIETPAQGPAGGVDGE